MDERRHTYFSMLCRRPLRSPFDELAGTRPRPLHLLSSGPLSAPFQASTSMTTPDNLLSVPTNPWSGTETEFASWRSLMLEGEWPHLALGPHLGYQASFYGHSHQWAFPRSRKIRLDPLVEEHQRARIEAEAIEIFAELL